MNFFIQSKTPFEDYDAKLHNDKTIIAVDKEDILNKILEDAIHCRLIKDYYCIDTEINGKHIVVCDCDSEIYMLTAARYLKILEIGYAVLKSTNDRYWVVTDIIYDTVDEAVDRMREMPGLDPRHTSYSKRDSKIFLRAYPKHIFNATAKINEVVNVLFPNDHTLKSNDVITWYNQLKDFYSDHRIIKYIDINNLHIASINGTVGNLIGNPNFKI